MNGDRKREPLPGELEIIPSAKVPLPETIKWRLDKDGSLPRLRIGRRAYYRLSDWQAFLNRAEKAPPVAVPWAKKEGADK